MDETISNLRIAPNPVTADTGFSISFISYSNENVAVTIWDHRGRIVVKESVNAFLGQNTVDLDTFNIAGGTYFITVSVEDTILVKRLLVK